MNKKIVFSLFTLVLLFGLIGVVLSTGETTKTVEVGVDKKNIGNLIGSDLNPTDVIASNVFLDKGENENNFSFGGNGYIQIKGIEFKNIEGGSKLNLDNSGNIKYAYLLASEEATFTFNDIGYKIPKGSRIEYKNGKVIFYGIYGNTGDSFQIKNKLLDESGKDIGKFVTIKRTGESIIMEKDSKGNSILQGKFDMGSDKISGKVTLSKDGKINEVWKDTFATIKGVKFRYLEKNLNIYYDENFVASSHNDENYFNYGKNKISAGGNGFTSTLEKSNNIFGDMQATKVVKGIGTKTRDLSFTLNGGNLEISKDTSKSDLSFNVNGNGDYVIDNGRVGINSKDGNVLANVFVDEKGLLYSYDLNINEGEYSLKSNFFKNKGGDVLINANKPWENAVYIARNINLTEAKFLRSEMEKEDKMIYVDDPYFLTWIQGDGGEAIMKQTYLAAESANKNIYGVKISPIELYTAMKSEGAGYMPKDTSIKALYEKFLEDPNWGVIGMETGLTYAGSPQEIKTYKAGNFIPANLEVRSMDMGALYKGKSGNEVVYSPALTAKDAFTYFAGVLAQKKYLFLQDYEKLYPERTLTSDEELYWTRYYFNAGEGSGLTALKNIDKNYVAIWEGGRPEEVPNGNPKFNARIANDFIAYLRALGIFDYPV